MLSIEWFRELEPRDIRHWDDQCLILARAQGDHLSTGEEALTVHSAEETSASNDTGGLFGRGRRDILTDLADAFQHGVVLGLIC